MALVPIPLGSSWHFANVENIVAIRSMGPRKCVIILEGGTQLEASEDSHVVNKRIEDFVTFVEGR